MSFDKCGKYQSHADKIDQCEPLTDILVLVYVFADMHQYEDMYCTENTIQKSCTFMLSFYLMVYNSLYFQFLPNWIFFYICIGIILLPNISIGPQTATSVCIKERPN